MYNRYVLDFLVLFGFLALTSTLTYSSTHKPYCVKQIRVGILDTGLDLTDPRFKGHLCPKGHKNFVRGETLDDINGHGTHVAGLIQKYAKDSNYCFLIYKYYSTRNTGPENISGELNSLKEAIKNKADIVNFSGGGPEFSEDEYAMIKNNPQITFVVAAGNDGQSLDESENNYFPASYWLDNEEVVENIDYNGRLVDSSNYSYRHHIYKEIGLNVLSYLPNGEEGYLTGTSQSTAIHSGKLIDTMSKTCNN